MADAAALARTLASIARARVRAVAASITAPEPTPDRYRTLLGIYLRPEHGMFVRLEWRDGRLCFVDPDTPTWRPTLVPTDDPDVFVVEPGCRESGGQVVLRRLGGSPRSCSPPRRSSGSDPVR